MNTIEEAVAPGRRRRRRYSVEFKAQVVAACQGPGVSLAAIALHHKLNANLLRRWVEQAETNDCVLVARSDLAAPLAAALAPEFVPLPVETRDTRTAEIRVEVRRADLSITVSWPTSEAAQCAAWLREWIAYRQIAPPFSFNAALRSVASKSALPVAQQEFARTLRSTEHSCSALLIAHSSPRGRHRA